MTNPITTSASRLRLVLFIGITLAIVAIVFLVSYGVRYLDNYAEEVNQTVYEATTSNDRLAAVRRQVSELENNPSAISRAKQIVAESQSYQYQDVIIRDLQAFANRAGVRITNFNFASDDSPASGGAATPEPAPAANPSPEGSQAADPSTPVAPVETAPPVSQLKSTTVSITLDTPVDYRRLLQFINYIEQNLTKMQIASITMSGGENRNTVTSDALTIEVYIR